MYFDIEEWLEQVRNLERLIVSKQAERDRFWSLATNSASKPMDGMPYSNTGTVSRKVESLTVELATIDAEIDVLTHKFNEHKQNVINALEKLPQEEYAVLHHRYICYSRPSLRYRSWEEIAFDMGYCTSQIWRIKKKALKKLKDAIKCNEMQLNEIL